MLRFIRINFSSKSNKFILNMDMSLKCDRSLNCNTKMSLLDSENNNVSEIKQTDDLYIANEKLCHDDRKKLKLIQVDKNTCAVIDTPETKLDLRRILQLGCVMYAMVFCGMVYGYTSPAFPSLISKQKGTRYYLVNSYS